MTIVIELPSKYNSSLLPAVLPTGNSFEQNPTERKLKRVRKRKPDSEHLAALSRECGKHEQVPEIRKEWFQKAMRVSQCCSLWELGLRASGRRAAVPVRFCHVKFCPLCAARRSARLAMKFGPVLSHYESVGHRIRFLTLTVPNCQLQELREAVKDLFDAWGKLRRQKLFRGCVGTLAALDITINKENGSIHHHLHIILVGGDYIDQRKISAAWEALTGGHRAWITDTDDKRLKELLKYQIKVSDIGTWQQLEGLTMALNGVKAIRATGVLRGIAKQALQEDENDEIDEVGADSIVESFGYFGIDNPLLEAWVTGLISIEEMRARSRLRI